MSSTTTLTQDEIQRRHKLGVGGSEVAALFGISPYKTALTLWLEKTGRAAPTETNLAMRLGNELEDFVAQLWCEETGRGVVRYAELLKDGPIIGNVDRLVIPQSGDPCYYGGEILTDEALECKTASRPWEDGVPLHYQLQCQHYMALMPRVRRFHVAVLDLAHKQFAAYVVERDEAVIADIRETVPRWWREYVLGDKAPGPVTTADCRLAFRHPKPTPVTASRRAEEVAWWLAKMDAAQKVIDAETDKAKAFLMASMGDAGDTLVSDGGDLLATWKAGRGRTVTDWKAVALEAGADDALIAKHTEVREASRALRLKVSVNTPHDLGAYFTPPALVEEVDAASGTGGFIDAMTVDPPLREASQTGGAE